MNYDALLPDVLPHVPGCPDVVAEIAIKNAAIDFCQRALVWQEDLTPITPEEDETEYDLSIPAGAALVKITNSDGDVDLSAETITFADVPTEETTLRAALKPTRAATTFPDFIGEQWGEVLASGALARLLAIPGKNWSSPKLAAYHHELFERGISEAVARRVRNYSKKSHRVLPYAY